MNAADRRTRRMSRVLTRTLVSILRRRPRAVLRLAAWSLAEVAPTLLMGLAVAHAVDAFQAGRTGRALAWLGTLALAGPLGAFGCHRLYAALAALVEPLRDELVRTVVAGALRAPDGRHGTGAVARLTHQVEIVRDTFAGLLMVVRGFVFSVVAASAGLLALAPVMLALVVPPLLAGLALFCLAVPAAAARQRELIVGEERLAEVTAALAEGLRDVTACGAEEQIAARAGERVDAQAAATRALARLAGVREAALALGGWLPVLLILAFAPWLSRQGVTAGAIAGAVTYVLQGLRPALSGLISGVGGGGLRLAVTLTRILEAAASEDRPGIMPALPAKTAAAVPAEGVRPVRKAPVGAVAALGEGTAGGFRPETASPTLAGAGEAAGGVEVRLAGVRFAYGEHAEPVIDGLDLVVPAGGHLAVVGPSGIGKSTLAALIAGLLEPVAGTVLVGGRPPGDARLRTLIPQEAYVFHGTLHENLTYLAPWADDEAVRRAVDVIGLSPLVQRLGGYGAQVDPAALSAGERQLIALGRAYLARAPLTVLDEATCHLDPAAEARAELAFARGPGTLIVIAHRMTSARRARRILLLDGTGVWQGGHEELLRTSAPYRSLLGR